MVSAFLVIANNIPGHEINDAHGVLKKESHIRLQRRILKGYIVNALISFEDFSACATFDSWVLVVGF